MLVTCIRRVCGAESNSVRAIALWQRKKSWHRRGSESREPVAMQRILASEGHFTECNEIDAKKPIIGLALSPPDVSGLGPVLHGGELACNSRRNLGTVHPAYEHRSRSCRSEFSAVVVVSWPECH